MIRPNLHKTFSRIEFVTVCHTLLARSELCYPLRPASEQLSKSVLRAETDTFLDLKLKARSSSATLSADCLTIFQHRIRRRKLKN